MLHEPSRAISQSTMCPHLSMGATLTRRLLGHARFRLWLWLDCRRMIFSISAITKIYEEWKLIIGCAQIAAAATTASNCRWFNIFPRRWRAKCLMPFSTNAGLIERAIRPFIWLQLYLLATFWRVSTNATRRCCQWPQLYHAASAFCCSLREFSIHWFIGAESPPLIRALLTRRLPGQAWRVARIYIASQHW